METIIKPTLLALMLAATVPAWAEGGTPTGEAPVAVQEQSADATADEAASSEVDQYLEWARQFWHSLKPQKGKVELEGGMATLEVPDSFYFLGPEDSERVLTEAWNNPPGSNAIGMLFPDELTPFDNDSWAVLISYDADGYVSDEDADKIDYDELLADMKEQAVDETKERLEQGFDSIEIVGWAAKPYYDKTTHKLHWAKEIKFGSQESNTLNYNIRALGRKGVLVFNFVADIKQKADVEKNLDTVLAMSSFNSGYRYDEFDPGIDEVAAYGIGALVAGKVAAKAGLFAAALLLLKKFWFVLLLIPVAFAKLFKRKKNGDNAEA